MATKKATYRRYRVTLSAAYEITSWDGGKDVELLAFQKHQRAVRTGDAHMTVRLEALGDK
jgi:hypothetical protein